MTVRERGGGGGGGVHTLEGCCLGESGGWGAEERVV